jgi:transcriptional regulator GlxA family with amidase domain
LAGGTGPQPSSDKRVTAAKAYLDRHLSYRVTLADLAREAHLSAEHFSVLFRRVTGQTPMTYVRFRRMEAARGLLATSAASIAEVARAVGFPDPFHFSRVFHRLVGTSPSAYRESFKNPFLT